MTTTSPPSPPGTPPPDDTPPEAVPQARNLYVVIGAVLIAMLLASLDNLILGTAMPSIVGELGGLDHLSWVVTAYTLATAVSTPVWGKAGDMYGRKGAFLASIVIFLAGSALAGLSQDMTQLVAFRAVQGLGAGGLMVGALAIISSLVPPREMGRYQGMIAGTMGLAMIGGPLVGGAITDHLGWRWCFYLNLPLGIVALVMVGLVLHLPKLRATARIDYAGVAALATTITSIVLITTWGGGQYGWTSPAILGLGALAAVAFGAFLAAERRVAEPVLPLGLFRSANFSLVTVIAFLLGFGMFGAMTFLPLFQQTVQGASASSAGMLGMPMFLAMVAVNLVAGPVITRTGRYKVFLVAAWRAARDRAGAAVHDGHRHHPAHHRPVHGAAGRRDGLPDADHADRRAPERRAEGPRRRVVHRHPRPDDRRLDRGVGRRRAVHAAGCRRSWPSAPGRAAPPAGRRSSTRPRCGSCPPRRGTPTSTRSRAVRTRRSWSPPGSACWRSCWPGS